MGARSPSRPSVAGAALALAAALHSFSLPVRAAGPALPTDVTARLESGDPARVKSALDDVRVAGKGGARVVPVIAKLLEEGLPPELTQAAIDTLADTESPAASDVLAVYARHRTLSVRKAALQALAKTKGPAALKALRAALSDPEPSVRGIAGSSLGGLKAHEALPDLFRALDRGLPEAAVSIGELCTQGECEELAGKLGKLPFDVVTSGIDEVLFRPPAEISEEIKVKIVEKVRDVGTGPANHFLKQVQAKLGAKAPLRVKQSVDAAVQATNLSPGSHGDPQ